MEKINKLEIHKIQKQNTKSTNNWLVLLVRFIPWLCLLLWNNVICILLVSFHVNILKTSEDWKVKSSYVENAWIAKSNALIYIVTKGNIIFNHYLYLGHYQAIGRVIHLNHLKELLQKQKSLDFDATRKNMDNLVSQLDILADTLYLEVLFVFIILFTSHFYYY